MRVGGTISKVPNEYLNLKNICKPLAVEDVCMKCVAAKNYSWTTLRKCTLSDWDEDEA